MKKILFIAVILMGILPFFGNVLNSSCFAQNMASESLWDKADETGYYGSYRCDYCGEVFTGNNMAEVEEELEKHISKKHFGGDDEDEDNDDNDESDDGSSNDNGSSGNNIDVIDIQHAATIAQEIGLDDKNSFLNNYYYYDDGFLFDKVDKLTDFFNFITYRYGAIRVDMKSIPVNYKKYFIVTPSYSEDGYHYCRLATSYSSSGSSDLSYGIYMFN